MSKKKIILAVASVAMVATLAIGGTLAYFTDSDNASNTFTMGKVDIALEETSNENDGKTGIKTDDGIEYSDVMPGDVLSKDVKVTVDEESQDAYILVKVEVESENIDAEKLAKLEINVTDAWTLVETEATTYYYMLNEVASAEDVLQVFTTVTVPGADWGNEEAEGTFSVNVTAYAIQKANLTPEAAQAELLKNAKAN